MELRFSTHASSVCCCSGLSYVLKLSAFPLPTPEDFFGCAAGLLSGCGAAGMDSGSDTDDVTSGSLDDASVSEGTFPATQSLGEISAGSEEDDSSAVEGAEELPVRDASSGTLDTASDSDEPDSASDDVLTSSSEENLEVISPSIALFGAALEVEGESGILSEVTEDVPHPDTEMEMARTNKTEMNFFILHNPLLKRKILIILRLN